VWRDDKIERVLEKRNRDVSLPITHDITVTRSDIEDVMLESYFSALAETASSFSGNRSSAFASNRVRTCGLSLSQVLEAALSLPQ
jgi:two-component sensor histidine kinase